MGRILWSLGTAALRNISTRERMRQMWMQQRRLYRDYKVFGHEASDRTPKDFVEAQALDSEFFDIVKREAQAKSPDTLHIHIAPEFNYFRPNAPVPKSLWNQLIESRLRTTTALDSGVLIAFGSDAVDLEEVTSEGKRRAQNIAVVAEGGSSSHMRIVKLGVSPQDGWDSQRFDVQRGTGEPRTFVLTDKLSGEQHVLGIQICLEHGIDMPADVQLLLLEAAGAPQGAKYRHTYDLLVADNPKAVLPSEEEEGVSLQDYSGLWEASPNGLAKTMVRRLRDSDSGAGLLFKQLTSSALLDKAKLDKWLASSDAAKLIVKPDWKNSSYWTNDKPRLIPPPSERTVDFLSKLDDMRREGHVIEWMDHSSGEHGH